MIEYREYKDRRIYRRAKLMATARDMCSADSLDNLQAEYDQLCIRIDGIKDSIKYFNTTITPLQLDLFEQQLSAMVAYKNVIELRASIENVKLKDYKADLGA